MIKYLVTCTFLVSPFSFSTDKPITKTKEINGSLIYATELTLTLFSQLTNSSKAVC